MNEIERRAREDFYRTNGKTPEKEAEDSNRVLGLLFLAGSAMIVIGLVCYLFS